MRRSTLLTSALWFLVPACAAPPPSGTFPYDGSVGNGADWDVSVDRVRMTVDRHTVGRTISPLIYGYNAIKDPAAARVAALRAGGNRFTAYNWENNASNAGNDYMFQNDAYLVMDSATPDAPAAAVRPTLDTARQLGAAAILTIPNVDYVSADKLGGGDVTKSGADYLMTRFKRNRPTAGGAPATTPDVTDGFVNQDEFVAWVAAQYPDVPVLYAMDNEPDLWSSTHKEVHPAKVTYTELVARNLDFARAVKAVSPAAPVLGFVSYGWQGYVNLQNAPDAGGDFIEYYLTKMKAAEVSDGKRLIDDLDVHWYPEATGIGASGSPVRITDGAGDTSPGLIDARVQAPRSLWDPDYREQSWIALNLAGPIALIPRLQQKIDRDYPGTKLAITEWNYGGGGHISGAVATADVLGVFGREGVNLANVWPTGTDTFTQAALALFRNYDGAGAGFGDTSVSAETSSIRSSSVYASVDAADPAHLVIVAINKRSAPTQATIQLTGDSSSTGAAVWVLAGDTPVIQPGAALTASSPGTLTYQMPPLSVSVVVPSRP